VPLGTVRNSCTPVPSSILSMGSAAAAAAEVCAGVDFTLGAAAVLAGCGVFCGPGDVAVLGAGLLSGMLSFLAIIASRAAAICRKSWGHKEDEVVKREDTAMYRLVLQQCARAVFHWCVWCSSTQVCRLQCMASERMQELSAARLAEIPGAVVCVCL
jgi:hypothetical protein